MGDNCTWKTESTRIAQQHQKTPNQTPTLKNCFKRILVREKQSGCPFPQPSWKQGVLPRLLCPAWTAASPGTWLFSTPLKALSAAGPCSSHQYQVTREALMDVAGGGVREEPVTKAEKASAEQSREGKGSRSPPVSPLQMLRAASELRSTPAITIAGTNWLKWLHALETCQLLHLSHLYLQSWLENKTH